MTAEQIKEAIQESQARSSITHRELIESGKRVTRIKTTGYGDSALSLVEYDGLTNLIYTNGDPVQCESWEHGLELLSKEEPV